jgi:uncharacterized protein
VQPKQRILITGGSGLVGKHLSRHLEVAGYEVAWLVRNPENAAVKSFYWNPYKKEMDEKALYWANHIIHLAGAGIADKPWSKERKEEIIRSRVEPTLFLKRKLEENNLQLSTLIAASAVGYYGFKTTDKIFRENDNPSDDFLGDTCVKWEQAHEELASQFHRTVIMRVGIVLAKEGGALPKMSAPVYFMAGAPLGSGNQYLPWIHMDDLCRMFLFALQNNEMKGIYNSCGKQHTTNAEFTKAIGKAVGRPVFLPNVPAFFIKTLFGEMAGMVLEGSRVSSEKIEQAGFSYQYPELETALKNLL